MEPKRDSLTVRLRRILENTGQIRNRGVSPRYIWLCIIQLQVGAWYFMSKTSVKECLGNTTLQYAAGWCSVPRLLRHVSGPWISRMVNHYRSHETETETERQRDREKVRDRERQSTHRPVFDSLILDPACKPLRRRRARAEPS